MEQLFIVSIYNSARSCRTRYCFEERKEDSFIHSFLSLQTHLFYITNQPNHYSELYTYVSLIHMSIWYATNTCVIHVNVCIGSVAYLRGIPCHRNRQDLDDFIAIFGPINRAIYRDKLQFQRKSVVNRDLSSKPWRFWRHGMWH